MSNVMELRGIEKTFYDGGRELRILRGVNAHVEVGKILAISGPSGVGKIGGRIVWGNGVAAMPHDEAGARPG